MHQLNDNDFDEFLSKYNRSLVWFYAPWCDPCKRLLPNFTEAAKTVAAEGSDTPFAMVDATAAPALAEKYKIDRYPTLLWFENGQPTEYTRGRSPRKLSRWVLK